MAEHGAGFVYRNAATTSDVLRELLAEARRGWGWTPATMIALGRGDLLAEDEGRAWGDALEVRWRRNGEHFDVLLLMLQERAVVGFELLPAPGGTWRTRSTAYRLQRPAEAGDEQVAATAFLLLDGTPQFVALMGTPGGSEQ